MTAIPSYKKLNFNTNVLQHNGEALMRVKTDKTKLVRDANGRAIAPPIEDADGNPTQEPVILCEMLAAILDMTYIGEEKMEYSERLKRGKLARKIYDKSASAAKNYQREELEMLMNTLTKAQASPSIIAQVDDMINATPEEKATQAA